MYTVKRLDYEEMEALRIQFPFANIREYQLLEDNECLGYESTYEEAETEIRKWEGRDALRSIIEDKLPTLVDELERSASWYGIDSTEVRNMLRGAV